MSIHENKTRVNMSIHILTKYITRVSKMLLIIIIRLLFYIDAIREKG